MGLPAEPARPGREGVSLWKRRRPQTREIRAAGGLQVPLQRVGPISEEMAESNPLRDALPSMLIGPDYWVRADGATYAPIYWMARENPLTPEEVMERVALNEVRRGFERIQASLCRCQWTHEGCCEHEPERLSGDCPVHGWSDGEDW